MKRLYMISGKAGSGKDFLGNILEKRGFNRFAFADHLKEMTSFLYRIPIQDLNTQEGKKKIYDNNKTYRQLLIDQSNKYKLNDKYFFAKPVIDGFKRNDFFKDGVVTDFRFPEEYEYAKRELTSDICEIKTILIKRDNHIPVNDISETALDLNFDFDYIIDNNGDTENLNNQLFLFNL